MRACSWSASVPDGKRASPPMPHTSSLMSRVRMLLTAADQFPNLGVFIPPGSTSDSTASAPVRGTGRRLGKALAGKEGERMHIV